MSAAKAILAGWRKRGRGDAYDPPPPPPPPPPPLKRAAAPTGPGVSPLYHLGQAEESLRKAAEASMRQWPTGRTARILDLLRQVEGARKAME